MSQKIIALFAVLKGSVDNITLYPPGNPIVERQFQNLKTNIVDNQKQGKVLISVVEGMVQLHGQLLDDQITKTSALRWAQKHFYERHIVHLEIDQAISIKELQTMGKILARPATDFSNSDHVLQFAVQAGLQHARFFAQRETTTPTPSMNATFQEAPQTAPEPALPQIPEAEAQELKRTISQLVLKNRHDKVQEILHHIRQDLLGQDQNNQELAVLSFQIVLEALAGLEQEPIVLQIYRSMPKDFSTLKHPLVFEYYINNFRTVFTFLANKDRFQPLIAGLEYLGEPNNLDHDQKARCQRNLNHIVDENILNYLIQTSVQVRGTKDRIFIFLKQHGLLLISSILKLLYNSPDRQTRHTLMTLLAEMGPVIYPELSDALRTQIEAGAPWYVKRNLLQLLSVKPPAELFDVIQACLEEDNVKIQDLAFRALYSLHGREPVELGVNILKGQQGPELVKFLNYIGQGGVKSYSKTLMELIDSDLPADIKKPALMALAHLDVHDGNQFILGVLNDSGMFQSKSKQALRVYAAEAAATSKNPSLRKALLAHVNDRNREVRDIIGRALS